MMPTPSLLFLAACLYALGGIAMKFSHGFQFFTPSCLVYICFGIAASLQTWASKSVELGKSYLFVLGFEGVLAVIAGIILFQEGLTLNKCLGMLFVLSGVALLKV
jgi:multidrug transporter EmrE-like cation transporter